MSQRKIKKLRALEKITVKVEDGEILKHSIKDIVKNNWIFLAIISIGIIFLFLNALKGDFVSDDYATIINNGDIKSLRYFSGNLTPVVFMNFLIGNLFGIVPLAYHIFSIFFYILTCWLAFIFLNFLTSEKISRIALIIFAVMPIHVEAVSWISGKPYLFLAFFIMFSTIVFIKFLEDGKYRYLLFGAISFLLAIMADLPRPFSLFFVIGLYLILVNKKLYWQKIKTVWSYLIALIVVVLLVKLPYAADRVGVINSGYNQSDSVFYNPFFQYPTGIPKYLQLMFFPVDLTLYHTMYIFPLWLNWSIFLLFFALIAYFFFKYKLLFFSLMFFLVTLLPSMAPIKVSWLVAERYGYLPSLGIAFFMAIIINNIWNKNKYLAMGIIGCYCIIWSVRIYQRNIDWQTNHNLWVNTCQVSPNSHNAWNNIGDDYDKLKQYDYAVKGFTQSVLVKPNYADAYHNRANIFFKTGRLDLARESYETALRFSPSLFQTYLSLTQIDLYEKRGDLALAHASKAVEMQPNDPQAQYALGVVKAQIGQLEEAKIIFQSILSVYPDYAPAKSALIQISGIKIGNT
jgi:tetratricopeptide (TPR) repeat protein